MTEELPLAPTPLPQRRPGLWAHLLLILPLPLVAGLIGTTRHSSHRAALSDHWQGLLVTCAFEMLVFGAFLALALRLSRTTRDDLMLHLRRPWQAVFVGMGYSVLLRLGLLVIASLVAGILVATHVITPQSLQDFATANRPDVEALVNLSALKNDPAYYWLTLTLVSFGVAGLREELWRAASLSILGRLWPRAFGGTSGPYAAVVLTAIIFGLGHATQGVLAMALTAVLGLMLGAIMVFHRSIWPAVMAHGFFDATTFALLPLASKFLEKAHCGI